MIEVLFVKDWLKKGVHCFYSFGNFTFVYPSSLNITPINLGKALKGSNGYERFYEEINPTEPDEKND